MTKPDSFPPLSSFPARDLPARRNGKGKVYAVFPPFAAPPSAMRETRVCPSVSQALGATIVGIVMGGAILAALSGV